MNKFIKGNILMKKRSNYKIRISAARLYSVIGCIFIIFLVHMIFSQNIDTYSGRVNQELKIVENSEISELEDKDTPLGIKRQYKWVLKDIEKGENSLAFYTVHQYAEVYFNGELMYSLNLQEGNKIGQTTGNNWVIIPIYPEDEGVEVCVNITPVYDSVRNRQVTFFIGSKFEVYLNQFKSDLPQIILSIMAIVVGVLFIIISTIYKYKIKENSNLVYLGIFSLTIGVWKLTDIRFAPLIFTGNTMAVSYISITMISLSVVPLLLVIKKQFLNKYSHLLELISIIYCAIPLIIIIAQITNVADFRETLYMAHIAIAIVAILVVLMVMYEAKTNNVNKRAKTLYIYLLLCIIGAIIDMAIYYIQGHSAGILCTLIAFLVYIIYMGYMSIKEINYKANIDIHTGLFNKSCCNEILDENEIIRDLSGVIMFDLNRLKYTNDTFGHENGDVLIAEFAYILRESISSSNFIGRYGGDEFIAVIKEVDEKKIQQIDEKISKEVELYNLKNSKIPMSYSMGYALSSDYPELTLRDLLKKADDYMYRNKKLYHNKNSINV